MKITASTQGRRRLFTAVYKHLRTVKIICNYSDPCEMEEESRIMLVRMNGFSGISYGEK